MAWHPDHLANAKTIALLKLRDLPIERRLAAIHPLVQSFEAVLQVLARALRLGIVIIHHDLEARLIRYETLGTNMDFLVRNFRLVHHKGLVGHTRIKWKRLEPIVHATVADVTPILPFLVPILEGTLELVHKFPEVRIAT